MSLPIIALAGNPNTGKTSLFNRLTGANARVGNYPGITVERESGTWKMGDRDVEVVDVPGSYSLTARSAEEQVALRSLLGLDGIQRPHLAVMVIDSTQLVRNLYLTMQVLEAGIPTVIALNLIDAARAEGRMPEVERLRDRLGVPVVPVSARTGEGLDALGTEVTRVLLKPELGRSSSPWRYPAAVEADIRALDSMVQASSPDEARAMALWALLSLEDDDDLLGIPASVRVAVRERRQAAEAAGRDLDAEVIAARYRWLDQQEFVRDPGEAPTLTERVDRWLLHPALGGLAFLTVMGVLFQSLFSWSDPAITLIETAFAALGDLVRTRMAEGLLNDFVVNAVINGVGSVLVFLPQILLLFFLIGMLEDSGYMARVAYLVDRVMRGLGLHGRAFVPMLSGYACAVPAIMATRTLESRRDRLLTMMVVPLMSCSARLPVYGLVIAALFPAGERFGWLPVQGLLMVGMYVFSTGTALLAAGVLGRTLLRGKRMPLLIELPPYRMPRLRTVMVQMWLRARSFLKEAGGVIFVTTVLLWGLLSFPRLDLDPGLSDPTPEQEAEHSAVQLEQSYAGQLGRALEPTIRPLGFDWRVGIGLIGAFAAREVFVSTMGLVYGIGADVDEQSQPLREKMGAQRHADGSPVYTPLMGMSLLVFFALSAQCMSTLAVVRRESGSWAWTGFLFLYMTVLAWSASFVVYQGGQLLGL